MDTSVQTAQPIPLFYGETVAGVITQDLESGFDYVITAIVVDVPSDFGVVGFALEDESGISFWARTLDGEGGTYPGHSETLGELPIGPRTALRIYSSVAGVLVWISGYALTPPTQLHE